MMNFIKWSHYILGLVPKADIKDNLPENQISAGCRYIEIIKVFKINEIIADTKWIHATYRIFTSTVKSESLKIRLWKNKKGRSLI
jgi:hypothetical protein